MFWSSTFYFWDKPLLDERHESWVPNTDVVVGSAASFVLSFLFLKVGEDRSWVINDSILFRFVIAEKVNLKGMFSSFAQLASSLEASLSLVRQRHSAHCGLTSREWMIFRPFNTKFSIIGREQESCLLQCKFSMIHCLASLHQKTLQLWLIMNTPRAQQNPSSFALSLALLPPMLKAWWTIRCALAKPTIGPMVPVALVSIGPLIRHCFVQRVATHRSAGAACADEHRWWS